MSYKQRASADREAIFGPPPTATGSGRGAPSGTSSYKGNANDNRAALFGSSTPANSGVPASSSATLGAASGPQRKRTATTRSDDQTGSNVQASDVTKKSSVNISSSIRNRNLVTTSLSGAAKVAKMKEAEEYRKKAKAAMEKTFFSRPDPVVASTYYKRAAEAYKLCGENRLERLHRIACADMQMRQDSYSSAAMEYSRAAELSATSDEITARKQKEVNQLYKNAAEAWIAAGERGKAAECYTKAALGMMIDKDETENLDKPTHTALEDAVQFHVPDVLNRMSLLRMTNSVPPFARDLRNDNKYSAPTIEQLKEIAREDIAQSAYAHENVQQIVHVFVETGNYRSALYAAGALTALLEESGFATVSLFKAYLTETILQLAMGDVVAADKTFMDVHLQNTGYLSSRECELAEELVRATKSFDAEALEKLKSSRVLANVDPFIRALVQTLKISGKARGKVAFEKVASVAATASTAATARMNEIGSAISSSILAATNIPATTTTATTPLTDVYEHDNLDGEDLQKSIAANYNEMEDLMGEMGLNDSEDKEDDVDVDDDDIDLR